MNEPFESEEKQENVNKMLKVLAIISAFNCFAKAEINFPLFLFAIIMEQIVRVFYLIVITCFTDLVWVILWYKKYQLPEYQELSGTTYFLFYYSFILTCILLALKVVSFVYIACSSEMVRFYLTFDGIMKAITDLYNGVDEQEQKALDKRIK